jgi:NDP-sugar pyrophosphorylase family protein
MAKVDPSARFVGPVWIGEYAEVGAGAIVLGPALIGDKAKVGSSTLLRRVAVLKDAIVNNGTEMADTVLAPGVRVERRTAAAQHGSSTERSPLFSANKQPSLFKRALQSVDLLRASRLSNGALLAKSR